MLQAVMLPALAVLALGQQPVNPEAAASVEFKRRVDAYVELHRKLERGMAKTPDEASPQEVDRAQRMLGAAIQDARAGARQGDLFTPEMTAFVRRVLGEVFGGREGRQRLSSVMDENIPGVRLKVNQRYPDEIPLATMPADVLETLPALPEELEYRFIGDQLVLLDPHAHIVADFIPDALPGR